MLFVDEVWGRYHSDAPNWLSVTESESTVTDVVLFVEKVRPLLGVQPCVPLDDYLKSRWVYLMRRRRRSDPFGRSLVARTRHYSGCIVDDDALEVVHCLCNEACKRASQLVLTVVDGSDDGHAGHRRT
jgi:hypothetical protein